MFQSIFIPFAGVAAQHSQDFSAWFAHCPGLKVGYCYCFSCLYLEGILLFSSWQHDVSARAYNLEKPSVLDNVDNGCCTKLMEVPRCFALHLTAPKIIVELRIPTMNRCLDMFDLELMYFFCHVHCFHFTIKGRAEGQL